MYYHQLDITLDFRSYMVFMLVSDKPHRVAVTRAQPPILRRMIMISDSCYWPSLAVSFTDIITRDNKPDIPKYLV